MDYSKYDILFFDLDGTLLTSDKNISCRTIQSILACKERGFKIGVSTSRSERNSLAFIESIKPDIVISSGGALVKAGTEYIFKSEFSVDETKDIIQKIRALIGNDCEITVDTMTTHYWNYRVNPSVSEANWGDSIYSDFEDFHVPSLKICVEIQNKDTVADFYRNFSEYDCIKFSDGNWYKITKKNGTKENAIAQVVSHYHSSLNRVISFGDDLADIGMLRMCGLGIAMGNALDEVKRNADLVIGTNDEDGISIFIDHALLR